MQEGGERARVHHQFRLNPVHGAVDVKIVAVADVDRDAAKSAEIESGHAARHARIYLENEDLPLAIEERLGGEQNIRTQDSIDLVSFGRAAPWWGTKHPHPGFH